MSYDRKEYLKKYMVWFNMIDRCRNPLNKGYFKYGGRGITVCDRWSNRLLFWEDMESGYKEGLSLDRKDNDGNYEPSNCRWATPKEQASNRRSNTAININGVVKTLTQWIEERNLKPSTVRQRYYVYGWSAKKALGMRG